MTAPAPTVDPALAPTYCPASSALPNDLKAALESAAMCVVLAAGGRKVLDPDGLLLPFPAKETSLFQRCPPELDVRAACEWLRVNVPGLADLAAAYRSMELDKDLSLFLGASGQPSCFTCWHEAALCCRPGRGIPIDALRGILAGCRNEASVAHQRRTTKSRAFVFAEDFRSLVWGKETFTFTPIQAACVRVLWEERERGIPELTNKTILDLAGSRMSESNAPRVRDHFKRKKIHPAWGKVIVNGTTKGALRLADPPDE